MPSFTVYKGSPSGDIQKSTTTRPALRRDDVLVRITHSGVCGTDLHYQHADMALGHEGAGVVEATGPDVQELQPGDRVGWGYLHDSCGRCKQCLTGWETMCPFRKMYGEADTDQGSFGTHAVWREAFLFLIPEGLSNECAAPLMCGGGTVFNALVMSKVKSTDRVGIVGLGGLGHMGIQFAAKMGCQTVVFSGTESKRDEAMKLGATEFYATKGVKELKIGEPLDHFIITTSHQPDWNVFLGVLAPRATIAPLTVSDQPFTFPYMPLIAKGLRVQGCIIPARQVHRDMLDFAAHHGVKPVVMRFPLSQVGVTEALATLEGGKMRYRGVLHVD